MTYLNGHCLVAMPGMGDPRFEKAVIFVCSHTEHGAMGLVLNRQAEDVSFADIVEQLHITPTDVCHKIPVFLGGPVETSRGFVLHSTEFESGGTMAVSETASLSVTLDILQAMALGEGPRQTLLALGYAGWGPDQLEDEIRQNVWLTLPADQGLLFETPVDDVYDTAMSRLGVDPRLLSDRAGHA